MHTEAVSTDVVYCRLWAKKQRVCEVGMEVAVLAALASVVYCTVLYPHWQELLLITHEPSLDSQREMSGFMLCSSVFRQSPSQPFS